MNKNYKRGLESQLTIKERCLQFLIYFAGSLLAFLVVSLFIN